MPVLADVSVDGRSIRLEPATRHGELLWTDRPWSSIADRIGQPVRFHEFTMILEIGDKTRLMRKGVAPPLDRVNVAPRQVHDVEEVAMGDWVSGWLGVGSLDQPRGGYAQLAQGPLGEVIASFKIMLPEGLGSPNSSPETAHFLRYDPARNSVDYVVRVDEFSGLYLEGTAEVSEDLQMELRDCRPAVIFQYLVDAYPTLDVYPLTVEQAEEGGWSPCFDDEHPPPFEHLWRPVDLSGS